MNQYNTLGECAPSCSALEEIRARISGYRQTLYEISGQLQSHADRLHGSAPQEASSASLDKKPELGGVISDIFLGLDLLGIAISEVAHEVDRNTNIA